MTPQAPLPRRRPEPVPAQAGSPLPPHIAVRDAVLRQTLGRRVADDYAQRALADLDGTTPQPPTPDPQSPRAAASPPC